MIFEPTAVAGAFIIKPEPRTDHRGFFARMYCEETWKEHGLKPVINQCNASLTMKKGTVRGLHYQLPPFEEVKVIRCTKGSVFDVVVDRREGSETYGKYAAVELTEGNHTMLYVPEGCAHGYQTLEDNCEIFYLVSAPYSKESERGIRYDDPLFCVQWPLDVADISEKDAALPLINQ